MIESLESRRMLHSSTVTNGVLTIVGNAGNDSYTFQRAGDRFFFFPVDASGAEETETYLFADVRQINISAGNGNDIVQIGSLKIPVLVRGGRGDDTISGGDGNDTLAGEGGFDTVFGRGGSDFLDGGSEGDDIGGGAGNDTLDYSRRTANLNISLGSVADDGELGELDTVRTDVETVIGGSGNDRISTTSGRAVRFEGRSGNDTLLGGGGNDIMLPDAGRDLVETYGGVDQIFGQDNEIDTLNGGSRVDSGTFDDDDVLLFLP